MATQDEYNAIDCKEELYLVETFKGKYKGYQQSLLVNELNEMEIDFFSCTQCRGIMRKACQVGSEQISVCEMCAGIKIGTHPILKQRKKILELQAKCPLATRGCTWNGTLADVSNHIDLCQEFIVKCEYNCETILKRCELINHCSNECLNRSIICEYCHDMVVYHEMNQHLEVCLEFPILCPRHCGAHITRSQLLSHIETDCPNTIVDCHYDKFGCKEIIKRSEMEEHIKTNETRHLEMITFYAVNKANRLEDTILLLEKKIEKLEKADIQEQLKQDISGKAEIKRVHELEVKLKETIQAQGGKEVEHKHELLKLQNEMSNKISKMNTQQREENIRLSKVINKLRGDMNKDKIEADSKLDEIKSILEKLTFPVIMHNVIKQESLDTFVHDCGKRGIFLHSGPILRYEIQWKLPNLTLVIGYKAGRVVNVWITVGNRFQKPMEYKFKLTLMNNQAVNESLTFESPFIKLKPNLINQKSIHTEYPIAEIPIDTLSETRFRTANRDLAFTIQIQEVEDFSQMRLVENHIRRSSSLSQGASECEVYSSRP